MTADRTQSAPSTTTRFFARFRADVRWVIDCWPQLWDYLWDERRATT